MTAAPSSRPRKQVKERKPDIIALAQPSPVVPLTPVELRRNPPRLLNFRELCVFLDISERHGRHLIAERKLPVIRLGDRCLFDTSKILATLERMSA